MPRNPSNLVPVAGVLLAMVLLVLGAFYLASSLRRNARLKQETVKLTAPQYRKAPASTNAMIDTVLVTCRGVNLRGKGPAVNTALAEAVADEFKSKTDYFD